MMLSALRGLASVNLRRVGLLPKLLTGLESRRYEFAAQPFLRNKHLRITIGTNHVLFSTKTDCATVLPDQVSQGAVEKEEIAQTNGASQILQELSPDDQKRLKVLRLEFDVFFSTGVKVPDTMTDDDWLTVLQKYPTFFGRKRYYAFLFKKEKSRQSQKRKSARNTVMAEERRRKVQEEILAAGPDAMTFKNTFMLMIQERTMHRFYYNNVFYAMTNGPHLVFDFSYEQNMTEREVSNLFAQMQLCHQLNKTNREPFHFHFCNVKPGSLTESKLLGAFGNLSQCPISVTSQHYSEVYPKERLVYLSPNAPRAMDCEMNEDDVYIIGGIVDKAVEDPLTLARAKEEKLRTVRFPIDKHLRWIQGSKSLPLNHVMKILLELKATKDWKEAFRRSGMAKRKFEI